MQVMNTDQFSQTEVLVGQKKATQGFAVSDDPMLMSMLSTGFYANPLRTMIQEVMFNSWDAHLMGECTDTPIDIYINETSGLIFRDYGPGIHDDDIHRVYCVYGASTKRQDARQTGGFGLGCKSPFAYGESFTLTSHHKGTKSMYLVSRVSDDNNGRPGITPLVSIPTDETGIIVTIPLQSQDLRMAYRYIKDVLYLSGIKARIHSMDNEEAELYEAKVVAPKEYVMDTRTNHHERNIYAVYGGVRYEIPQREEYAEEYKFMDIINEISSLFIGFAPNTLTPLPNREGLNMSEKTKENIRIGLELCMEKFQEVFEPLVHAYIRQRFDYYLENGIEAHYALFNALGLNNNQRSHMHQFEEKMKPLVPLNTDKTVWEIAVRLMRSRISAIIDVIGEDRWMHIISQHFIRCYPEHKYLAFKMLKEKPSDMMYNNYSDKVVQRTISDWVQPRQMADLLKFEKALLKEFPESEKFGKPKLRMEVNGQWHEIVRHRNAGKRSTRIMSAAEIAMSRGKDIRIKTNPKMYDDPTRIWDRTDSEEINQFFQSKIVILAKTVTCLKETGIDERIYFSGQSNVPMYSYSHSGSYYGSIPAYVVHSRKGQYDKALEILTNMGFKVIEANEPEKKNYGSKPKLVVPQYHRLNFDKNSWQDDELSDEDIEDGLIPLTDPDYFLYVKISDLGHNHYGASGFAKPSTSLVHHMMKINRNIAMVNNQTQADSLVKKGVKPFEDLVKEWHSNMTGKIYRFRNIVRVIKIEEGSEMPSDMLRNQTIQQAMGIAKIQINDKDFWNEMTIIECISTDDYTPLHTTRQAIGKLIDDTWIADPMREKIVKTMRKTSVFNSYSLDGKWSGLDPASKGNYAKSIARFLRAV